MCVGGAWCRVVHVCRLLQVNVYVENFMFQVGLFVVSFSIICTTNRLMTIINTFNLL